MKRFFILALLFSIGGCSSLKVKSPEVTSDKFVVYQVFTRLFGNENTTNKLNGTKAENGVGKFNDFNDNALQSIKTFGATHVWYTGVIEHATMTDYSANGVPMDNPQVVKGIAGSPYAIKDYYDVNPDLAVNVANRMQEFEALVARTHANGLKVVIDFVPNHVARQYKSDAKPSGVVDLGANDDVSKSFSVNNNFYYIPNEDFIVPDNVNPPVKPKAPFTERPAKVSGNDVFRAKPHIDDWFETVKLNYGVDYQNNRAKHFNPVPDTWHKMRDILAFWTGKGVDAFRCDMAEMVPVEFWGWAIPQIKALNPQIKFIAEIYNPNEYQNYIQNGKFDYLYDKVGLYDSLRRLMEGGGNANEILGVQNGVAGRFERNMLRFLENHDEQRIASRFFGKSAEVGIPAMTLSATMHTGPLMYYFGQELGVNPTQAEGFQGDDGRTTIFDYWGVPEVAAWNNGGKFNSDKLSTAQKDLRNFYEALNRFILHPAIQQGKLVELHSLNVGNAEYPSDKVFSYIRYLGKEAYLFVYNFDLQKEHRVAVQLPNGFMDLVLGRSLGHVDSVPAVLGYPAGGVSGSLHKTQNQLALRATLAPNSFKVFKL